MHEIEISVFHFPYTRGFCLKQLKEPEQKSLKVFASHSHGAPFYDRYVLEVENEFPMLWNLNLTWEEVFLRGLNYSASKCVVQTNLIYKKKQLKPIKNLKNDLKNKNPQLISENTV